MRIVVHLNAVENFTTPPVPAAVEGGADSPGADPERSSFDIVFWRSSSRRSKPFHSANLAIRDRRRKFVSLRCYEPRGALSCGSPMPRGERIAKPTERWIRSAGFFVPPGALNRRSYVRRGSWLGFVSARG